MFDFSGWATKNDVKCRDGRVIRRNAFKDMDGKTVPLVWSHDHKSPDNVLGHAVLENRPEGVYCYCSLNEDTKGGKQTKALIKHGDLNSLSIYANDLVERGSDVTHGVIREVSVCLAGANPLAVIDNVMAHSMDGEAGGVGVIIYGGDEEPLVHSMEGEEEMYDDYENDEFVDQDEIDDEYENDEFVDQDEIDDNYDENDGVENEGDIRHAGLSANDILDTLTDEQFSLMDQLINDAYLAGLAENDNGGNEEMKHSVFENQGKETAVISHDALQTIFEDAKSLGSLKQSALAHAAEYGINDIDLLFPDAKATSNEPEFIKRKTTWVAKVLNGVKHLPFTRIKSLFADITEEEARAKGYIKGNRKVEEVFGLLKRQTGPCTIYKKQKLDRDDIIDIKDFNVVSWLRQEMRGMLDEEIARAILIGDGRSAVSPDKVKEDCIRPIWKDDELFTIKNDVLYTSTDTPEMKAKKFIKSVIKTRKNYNGSANITLFCGEDILSDMLLIEDKNERVIYDSVDKLKTVLRVSDIVTVPQFDTLTRVINGKTKVMAAILVDLNDYSVGTDKGGEVNTFDDFDIDYNQEKYLMETRCSGALTKPYSAMVYEFTIGTAVEPAGPSDPTDVLFTGGTTKVSDIQGALDISDANITGSLYYQAAFTDFDSDAKGYFLAIDPGAASGATVTVKYAGSTDKVKKATGDDTNLYVINITDKKAKIVITSTLNGETVEKTYAVTGLKLLKED